MMDNGWIGKFSFTRNQNATNTHTTGSWQTCRPLKRILDLNSICMVSGKMLPYLKLFETKALQVDTL